MEDRFKEGDVVRHRGIPGLVMTVESYYAWPATRHTALCSWFHVEQLHKAEMLAEDLELTGGSAERMAEHRRRQEAAMANTPKRTASDEVREAEARVADRQAAAARYHAEVRAREKAAVALYLAYGVAAGGVNYQCKPMPIWRDLPDNIRANWIAVAAAAERLFR